MVKNRKKAFVGTAIAVGASLLGSAISGAKQRNAAKKQAALEKEAAIERAAYQQAGSMQQSLNNDVIDDYYANKRILKNGGKVDMDRIKRAKKFACGGRKKAEIGTLADMSKYDYLRTQPVVQQNKINPIKPISNTTKSNNSNFGNFMKSEAGSAAIGAIGTISSALLSSPTVKEPIKEAQFNFNGPKTIITPNSYDSANNIGTATANNAQMTNNIVFEDRLKQQRLGGKSKRKCK